MMATAKPPSASSLLPLLESLEDGAAGQSEHTDAYLTIANRLSGEEARQFLPAVEKHFSRLGQTILTHMSSPTVELSQAALQALGFCLYHSHVVSGVPETFAAEIFSALCSLVVKSTDKNTCTRALWVISTQSFPPNVVGKKVSALRSSDNLSTVSFTQCQPGSPPKECGGVLTDQKRIIQSPGFPKGYQDQQICYWHIRVRLGQRIHLRFRKFDVEDDMECLADYLEVLDSYDDISGFAGRFCGDIIPGDVISTGNVMTLKFLSDASVTGGGFQLQYIAINATQPSQNYTFLFHGPTV